jgi:hypothetical protein
MPELPDGTARVLAGTTETGLRWIVTVEGDGPDLYTMLHVYERDRQVAGSGFAGPTRHDGALMHEWRGRTDGLPSFVMARVSPLVDRVVATTDRGSEVTLALSPVIEPYGLRFAAAPLPDGERPGRLRAERAGTVLATRIQPMPEL